MVIKITIRRKKYRDFSQIASRFVLPKRLHICQKLFQIWGRAQKNVLFCIYDPLSKLFYPHRQI